MVNDSVQLYAKCEFMNPGLSMKDRLINYILLEAEGKKDLQPGDTIICASSGNTERKQKAFLLAAAAV
jgi:cysteine synthase